MSLRSQYAFNIIVGLAAILIAVGVCLMGLSHFLRAQHATSSSKHDYQMVQLGDMRRDQFLIDKETGRIWVKTCITSDTKPSIDCDGATMWVEQNVVGINGYSFSDYIDYLTFMNGRKKDTDTEE